MSVVFRQALNSIQPDTHNSLVIGIIISSLNSKTFESRSSRYGSGTRAVWAFTLRDSETDFINVTVWGSVEFISKLTTSFHIGSVVEVINAKVVTRGESDKSDYFRPTASSPYALIVNQDSALIQAHEDCEGNNRFERLLRIPTKDPSGVRSIKSILDVIETMQDQLVDLLVVVTFVSESRTIVTRDGRSLVCRDFAVADGSCKESLSFKLWDHELIRLSEIWEARNTVLFIADARVAFDNFQRKMAVAIARKTLITENPDLPRTAEVRNIVKAAVEEYASQDPFAIPKPESIRTVMSIQEIAKRINEKKIQEAERVQFVTIVFASVTDINMAGIMNNHEGLVTRCALCKRVIETGNDCCMNLECPCGNGRRVPINVSHIYLKVNLRDETGYLIGCRLTGTAVERALDCTASQFAAMNLPEREQLTLKLCLEKCEVRLQVIGPTTAFPRALYNILSIKRRVDEDEEAGQAFDDETEISTLPSSLLPA